MRQRELFAVLLLASTVCGCATQELALAPDRPDKPWSATTENGTIVSAPVLPAAQGDGYVLPRNPALATIRPAPTLEAGHPYTLAELIDIAESYDPRTRIAWDQARDAALAAGIARSAFLPTLTASVIGGTQAGQQNKALDGSHASGEANLNGSISALSVKWLLFDFGERAAVLEEARQASVISNIDFTAAHQSLIYRVSLAFYADGDARAKQATAGQALQDARAIQAASDSRYKAGVGTVVEAASAHQATAQAEFVKIRADGAAEDARQALINAMGLPPTTRITVEDINHRTLGAEAVAPIDQLVSDAISRRPDVLAAYAAHEASLATVRAARAEFKPKVFLSASGAYSSASLQVPSIPGFGGEGPFLDLNGSKFGGTVLMGVTMPLYDGGVRDARLRQAHIDEDQAETQLTEVRDDAAREVISAGTTLKNSLAAYRAAEALVAASQTSFDAALAAYRNGVGSITDVNLAEAKLMDARDLATDSYSAALAAAASLALAVGAMGGPPAS
jgi:outer membrane protein